MCTLYENIKSLCEENGVTGGKMCVDLGISKSLMTSLKSGRTQNISVDNARKIAEYFNVSVSRVLGTDQNEKSPAPSSAGPNKQELLNLVDDFNDDQCANLLEIIKRMKNI